MYRRRFGIECSYRLLPRVGALTTSLNPALRFFLLGVGMVLLNCWVCLRWEFAYAAGRGRIRVDPQRFIRFLFRAIERLL